MYIKICVVGDVLDVITYAKFQNEIFRGYNFTAGRIFHFSYWFWMGLTTVQRYCAACDVWLFESSLSSDIVLVYMCVCAQSASNHISQGVCEPWWDVGWSDVSWLVGDAKTTTLKVLWDSTNPRESDFVANTCHTYYFAARYFRIFRRSYFVNSRRFTYGVFWLLLPHPSTDRNETRTWSSLSP